MSAALSCELAFVTGHRNEAEGPTDTGISSEGVCGKVSLQLEGSVTSLTQTSRHNAVKLLGGSC